MRQATLALTNFNRFDFLLEAVGQVLSDPRLSEVLISDDCSTDGSYERLVRHFASHPKVHVRRNQENLDCYTNKLMAVSRSGGEWVILFDSDNIMSPALPGRPFPH